jgi:hypothetical protein
MQAHLVTKKPRMKVGYVDPRPIAQIIFNYPSKWKLDCIELAAGETVEEKEKIRTRILAISFVHLQHNDVIWVPYNFK